MNWKRIIGVSASVLGAAAVVFLCVKTCEAPSNDFYNEANNANAPAKEAAVSAIDSIKNENARLRDSIDFYKAGLADCEKSKQQPVKPKPENKKPVVKPEPKPAKPAAEKQPVAKSGAKDTVYVIYSEVIYQQNGKENSNDTKINLKDSSLNNKNILVQNEPKNGSKTEITLGEGAVNDGNIVVNNGGKVLINDNAAAIDSLRNAVDSLKQKSAKGNYAAASSVIVVKKVKTYRRTR